MFVVTVTKIFDSITVSFAVDLLLIYSTLKANYRLGFCILSSSEMINYVTQVQIDFGIKIIAWYVFFPG